MKHTFSKTICILLIISLILIPVSAAKTIFVDEPNKTSEKKSILSGPELDITVQGNYIIITNIGDDDATNVEFSLKITDGGIIFIRGNEGTIPTIAPGQTVTRRISIFGLGSVTLSLKVSADGIPEISTEKNGKLIGFILII